MLAPRSAAPKQQVMLTAFFITLPMIKTSGAMLRSRACRPSFQVLSLLNPPCATSIAIAARLMLKVSALMALWPHALACWSMRRLLMRISVVALSQPLS